MREIKFRGIYTSNGVKRMVYGNFIKKFVDGKVFYEIENSDFDDFSNWTVDPETVGEFTGLKDKNGLEIYEGDIIKQGDNPECWFSPRVVEFKNGSWMGRDIRVYVNQDRRDYQGVVSQDSWEVLGNIHQNPELLK